MSLYILVRKVEQILGLLEEEEEEEEEVEEEEEEEVEEEEEEEEEEQEEEEAKEEEKKEDLFIPMSFADAIIPARSMALICVRMCEDSAPHQEVIDKGMR
jgi:FtsZ-interacting cell division protein YlmF